MEGSGLKVKGFDDYIPENEQVGSKYKIGLYTVLTTKERVVCIKKFPKSFVGIQYDEIDALEHFTRVRWSELIKGILMIAIAFGVYNYQQSNDLVTPIYNLIFKYLPEISDIIPIDKAILAGISASFLLGGYHLLKFIPSILGYFKISRKNRAPVLITTRLTSNVKNLVREIEAIKTEHDKEKEKQIVMGPGGMPMAAQPAVEEVATTDESIAKKMDEGLTNLRDDAIIIASAKSKDHSRVVSALLAKLVKEKGMGGVYISVSRPYDYIIEAVNESGADASQIMFVDCISQMAGKAPEKSDNVVFVENPGSLEEVSMYLDRMLSKVNTEKKFLFLDSLSSLLIYNNDKSVKEFTHFIINKMRLEKIAGVILSTEKKEAEDMVRTLIPMCDNEIKF